VVVVVVFVSSSRARKQREAEAAETLAEVRRVAEEDVTRLGEEVAALDVEVAGQVMDEGLRQDYHRALDAYEHAKAALDAVRDPAAISGVTEAIEDGRYAAACVRARVNGQPLPTRRPPCFFNPAHGPSTDDVDWAPPGGQPRPVPVCAADAERVRAGAEPDARKVLVGAQRRPYWDAGNAYAPYARGYFGGYQGSGLLPGVPLGAIMAGSFGGWDGGLGSGADGDFGGDGGADGGPGDGGGDAGGADGGDWGGGDFGGGDFGGGFGDFG
jgi:hypothetical protein